MPDYQQTSSRKFLREASDGMGSKVMTISPNMGVSVICSTSLSSRVIFVRGPTSVPRVLTNPVCESRGSMGTEPRHTVISLVFSPFCAKTRGSRIKSKITVHRGATMPTTESTTVAEPWVSRFAPPQSVLAAHSNAWWLTPSDSADGRSSRSAPSLLLSDERLSAY